MGTLTAVDERALVAHSLPEHGWVAEECRWPVLELELDDLIDSIPGVASDPERRRELGIFVPRLMLACHDAKLAGHERRGANQCKLTTAMQSEFETLASKVHQIIASPEDSDLRWIGIAVHIEKLSVAGRNFFEMWLSDHCRLRRANDSLYTLGSITQLDLAQFIDVIDEVRDTIELRPGSAGCPADRMLVEGLYDLWLYATGQPPRRSHRPGNPEKPGSRGIETGRFLAFCRGVLAAVETGQPYAGGDIAKRLSQIVRTVIDERKRARNAGAPIDPGAA